MRASEQGEAAPAAPLPLVSCFSYLPAVHTLHVDRYPDLNYGTDVTRSSRFLAGDGPIVAAALRALGHDTLLGTNHVADDPEGRDVLSRLSRWNVTPAPGPGPAPRTRVNVVVCDQAGNRTWFSGLRGITEELLAIDLQALAAAPAVYIDCYEVLGTAPRQMLAAALHTGAEVTLNLGGSPPPSWLKTAAGRHRVSAIQTNADENDPSDPARVLDALTALDVAETAIVTAGRHGAIARAHDGTTASAAALPVQVRQVQGAGAVFSAALIHSQGTPTTLAGRLQYACAAGSLWCSQPEGGDPPAAADIARAMRVTPDRAERGPS